MTMTAHQDTSVTTATQDASTVAISAPLTPFTVTFIIRRFNPDSDTEPRSQDFDVDMYSTDRVLDALHKIKWEQDGSLNFRRSCAHCICGSHRKPKYRRKRVPRHTL